jgi:hypothetical protein
MGFLSGLKNVFSGIGKAVGGFLSSGFGQTLMNIGLSSFLGPLAPVASNLVTGLIKNKGKLDFKSVLSAGLSAFGPLASKIGDTVMNLPSALKNPMGLLGGLLGGDQNGGIGSIIQAAGKLLGGTNLGSKISGIVGKASQFLGNIGGFGNTANNILGTVTGVLNDVGIKPPQFLSTFSDRLNSALGALSKVQEVLNQVGSVLTPTQNMIRA